MSSRIRVTLPSLRRAARTASSRLRPRARLSSISRARESWSSVARSASQRLRRKKRDQPMAFSVGRPEDGVDGANDLVPQRRLFGELRAALRREAVVARAAVVFGGAPEGGDPAAVLEAMQGGIERPVV